MAITKKALAIQAKKAVKQAQDSVITRWVKALKSGRYKQGKNKLGAVNGKVTEYCCLGVLCQIAAKDKIVKRKVVDGCIFYDGEGNYLPQAVQEFAGIRSRRSYYHNQESLANLNDARNKTFSEIADIIESRPEGLFV